jgi:hypothetical protein
VSTRLHIAALTSALLFVALLLGFAHAGAANAEAAPPEGWGVAYERAAVEYWGETATRCEGSAIDFDSSLPLAHRLAQGEGRVLGRATVAEAPGGHCEMWIAPLPGRGIYFRCVLFAHEYGHWLGYPDSPSDPSSSVAAELLGEYTVDAPCHRLVEAVQAENSD